MDSRWSGREHAFGRTGGRPGIARRLGPVPRRDAFTIGHRRLGARILFSSEDDRDACATKWRSLIEQAAGPRTRSALREWRPGANAATDAAACVLVNGLRSNAPDAFLASVIAPRIVTALEGLARTAVRGQRCDARWAGPWPDLLDEEGRDAVRRAARVLLRAQLKGALLTDDRSYSRPSPSTPRRGRRVLGVSGSRSSRKTS